MIDGNVERAIAEMYGVDQDWGWIPYFPRTVSEEEVG